MIAGVVTPAREAVLQLRLFGTSGSDAQIEVVVDTGFTEFVALPLAWINALALPYVGRDAMTLADGAPIRVDLYEATADWDGKPARWSSTAWRASRTSAWHCSGITC